MGEGGAGRASLDRAAGGLAVRSPGDVGVQPATAAALQHCGRGGEQGGSAGWLVVPDSEVGQCFQVVGDAWLVSGLGRQRQALPEQVRGVAEVACGLAAERQAVEGYQSVRMYPGFTRTVRIVSEQCTLIRILQCRFRMIASNHTTLT
jgi:hypothetical protein